MNNEPVKNRGLYYLGSILIGASPLIWSQSSGFVIFLVVFPLFLVITVCHRAAFRQYKFGIFAQIAGSKELSKLAKLKLGGKERVLVVSSLIIVFTAFISVMALNYG